MFSRDVSHHSRTPRTLQSSKFGPYASISIPQRRSKIVDALYVVLYGAAVGACWYALILLRVGA